MYKRSGFLSFCFAFIPGAGQMYQGYMKRGISIMTACALTVTLISTFGGVLFPMLLGRTAMARAFTVDPARSFLHGRRILVAAAAPSTSPPAHHP